MKEHQVEAIRRELLEQARFKEVLGNPRTLEVGGSERYPRLFGDSERGHIAIIVKFTGDLNASRFRYWLTLSPKEWHAVRNGPKDYHYFCVQVGRLPNGDPWWMALYDMAAVVKEHVIEAVVEEVNIGEAGHFFRLAPVWLPEEIRPPTLDLQTMTMDEFLEEPIPTGDDRVEMQASLAAYHPKEKVLIEAEIVEQSGDGRTVLHIDGIGKSGTWHAPSTIIPKALVEA